MIKAKADLEIRTNRHQTPLLLAIAKLNSPVIELLVENCKKDNLKKNLIFLFLDANVNSYDEDMDTGLHLVLNEASLDKNSDRNSSPVKIKLSDLTKIFENLSDCKIISQVKFKLNYFENKNFFQVS